MVYRFFFFSSRRRHTRLQGDWSSDVCSSDLGLDLEMAILPGMEELFSLLKVKTFAESGRYDLIVIDCAPTGDTVRMLGVPEILNFYFSRIFPIQRTVLRTVRPVAERMTDMPIPSDDVFAAVKALYEQMEGMGPLLQDPRRSSIRIVLNPEEIVIAES